MRKEKTNIFKNFTVKLNQFFLDTPHTKGNLIYATRN